MKIKQRIQCLFRGHRWSNWTEVEPVVMTLTVGTEEVERRTATIQFRLCQNCIKLQHRGSGPKITTNLFNPNL